MTNERHKKVANFSRKMSNSGVVLQVLMTGDGRVVAVSQHLS